GAVGVRGTVEGVGVAAHAGWGHVLGAKFTRRTIRRAPHDWCGTARVLLDGFADRNRDRNHRDVVDVVSACCRAAGGFVESPRQSDDTTAYISARFGMAAQ